MVRLRDNRSDGHAFVVRSKRLLVNLNHVYFTPNAKLKPEYLTDLDQNAGFVHVRLVAHEKGKIETFSQVYMPSESDCLATKAIQFETSPKKQIECLSNEDEFVENQKTVSETLGKPLIGFVNSSRLTLVDGRYSANGSIRLADLLTLLQMRNKRLKHFVYYRAPTSDQLKLAKIIHIYT